MNTTTDQFKSSYTIPSPTNYKDEVLWHIARKRASFKINLVAYLFTNTLLIALWYFTSGSNSYFWPVWSFLGWGLGLIFQYLGAYHSYKAFSVEKEYEKIKNQRSYQA